MDRLLVEIKCLLCNFLDFVKNFVNDDNWIRKDVLDQLKLKVFDLLDLHNLLLSLDDLRSCGVLLF